MDSKKNSKTIIIVLLVVLIAICVVNNYDKLPRSVTFTSATLGTVKKTSISIHINGSIRPKTGSTKSIKYRINYDRDNETAEIVRTTSN